mgnify:CR=1 FL=1
MSRLPPLTDAGWPPAIADMRAGFAGALNVYRVMAHHPALLRAWTDLRAHVVQGSSLNPQQSEVVILRTGVRRQSHYEWVHHVVRGFDCDLSLARIAALRGPPDGMEPTDRVLASAVDALINENALPRIVQDALIGAVGVQGLLDVIATVGFYTTLSYLLKSFETPVDVRVAERFAAIADSGHYGDLDRADP